MDAHKRAEILFTKAKETGLVGINGDGAPTLAMVAPTKPEITMPLSKPQRTSLRKLDRLTRQHIKGIEQEAKTPRTEAAFRANIHDASLEGIRREMRKLETELIAEREQRKLAGRVAKDALDARNRAEADRDNARAALREELLKHDTDWSGSGRPIR